MTKIKLRPKTIPRIVYILSYTRIPSPYLDESEAISLQETNILTRNSFYNSKPGFRGFPRSLVQCCLTEVSRPTLMTWLSTQSHYTDTQPTSPFSTSYVERLVKSRWYNFNVFGTTRKGIEPMANIKSLVVCK